MSESDRGLRCAEAGIGRADIDQALVEDFGGIPGVDRIPNLGKTADDRVGFVFPLLERSGAEVVRFEKDRVPGLRRQGTGHR